MKLLFNIENPTAGSEELKSILGFIDADLTIIELQSEIEDASIELRKIIGKQTYKFIAEKYTNEEDVEHSADIQALIRKAQAVVANHALRMYAPKSDVAITNNGRQMRMDEHHKAPFEWMIERNNEALERTHYRKIDYLIEHLDETNPTINTDGSTKWKDTDAFRNSFDILFRTTDEFNEFFTIDSRYLLMKLAPGIRKIKTEEIIPRMTAPTLDQYIAALKSGTPVPNPEILREIKTACAYLSLSWAIRRMSATLFPEGVLSNYIQGRNAIKMGVAGTTPMQGEVGVISELFKEDGTRALHRLEDLLRPVIENPEDVPLYNIDIKKTDKFVST